MMRALHAEWTKLRTIATAGWLLLASVAVTVAAGAVMATVQKCPASCGADTTRVSLTGIQLGQATVAVLAVLVIAGEYRTGMIRMTLTAVPRRTTMLTAKAAVLTGVVLAAGILGVLGSLLAGRIILPGNGFNLAAAHGFLGLDQGATLRAAAGSVLYLGLIALFSLGVATAVRDSAAATTVVLGLLYVLPVFGGVILNAHWQRRLERYSPMDAGLAVQATKNLAKLPIGPWQGLGVLAAWAAAALLAGGLLLRLRDA
jgi:ABC-2 type transport system permease protein